MQNNSNREYDGLKELLSLEEHMPNYNSYIMSLCSELVENKNQVVDFGDLIIFFFRTILLKRESVF